MAAAFLLLCAANMDAGETGFSIRHGKQGSRSGVSKSVSLSLKISDAKKDGRRVSFYKSVARQMKKRPTGGRPPSSGR